MNANVAALIPANAAQQLPARYEAARQALQECDRVDECKDWSDKAAALRAYALQAKDNSLHMLALRIHARAQRRMGELLKQIPAANGARTDLGREPTRSEAAANAGLSEHQRKTALRVASVPSESFDRQVESDSPPTVSALASQGTVKAPAANDPTRLLVSRARTALLSFADACARLDARQAGEAFPPDETQAMRQHVRAIDTWLDAFVTRLPE